MAKQPHTRYKMDDFRAELKHRGRQPIHPETDNKRLMTRTSEAEYDAWTAAAKRAARQLGLPHLTIGPWSRMVLNQAAKALGIEIPEDK